MRRRRTSGRLCTRRLAERPPSATQTARGRPAKECPPQRARSHVETYGRHSGVVIAWGPDAATGNTGTTSGPASSSPPPEGPPEGRKLCDGNTTNLQTAAGRANSAANPGRARRDRQWWRSNCHARHHLDRRRADPSCFGTTRARREPAGWSQTLLLSAVTSTAPLANRFDP
ncbi:Nn.00g100220.m01.CDS01 [Neocucurbitaria sp. VM-36]